MNHCSVFRVACVLLPLASLALCSCEQFEHPLSDETTSEVDEDLLGRWWIDKDGKTVEIIIRKCEAHHRAMEVLNVDGPDEISRIFAKRIGGKRYLSAFHRMPTMPESFFVIFRYEIADDGSLRLFQSWDDDFLAQAIAKGELAGTVSPKKPFSASRIRVSETPDRLAEFLAANGDRCFRKNSPLKLLPVTETDE